MSDWWLIERPLDGPLCVLSKADGLRRVTEEAWQDPSWVPSPVRMLGTHSNAPVIHALLTRGAYVELGTPQLLTKGLQKKPERVLTAMSQVMTTWLGPARGGWHPATEMDRLTYGMCSPSCREELWQQHPLRDVLQLVPSLDMTYASRLVSELRDPRWYIDPVNPNRGAKWHAYLSNPALKVILRRAWRLCRVMPHDTNFLWHYWHVARANKNEEMASRVVDRRFGDFLRYCWLAQVSYPDYRQLFDPARFLEGEALGEFLSGVRSFPPYEWCLGA